MSFRKDEIYRFFSFILTIIIGIFFDYGYIPLLSAILAYLYIGSFTKHKSSIHMMFFLGFSSFMFLPAILNWYYLDTSFVLFFVSSFIASFFLLLTKGTTINLFIDFGVAPKLTFVFMCLTVFVLIYLGLGGLTQSVFAFLIILMSLSFQQGKYKNNILYLSIFTFVLIIYILLSWSGYGRTLIVGWQLLAMLQFAYSIDFKVNKYAFGLLPGLGSTLLADRDFLELKFSGFESALNDSAFSPYRLATTFIEHFDENGLDVSGFWDQVIFTFFVFIPRDFWPDKPYGFGFEYTVQNLDPYLIDAGHSIAATLIGEHIYYLGYFGIFTALIVFLIIGFATNTLYRIKGLNGNGVLLFSASMMVLVWGGMTSFSARVALPSIMFVILFFSLRRFLTRKFKFVWRS